MVNFTRLDHSDRAPSRQHTSLCSQLFHHLRRLACKSESIHQHRISFIKIVYKSMNNA